MQPDHLFIVYRAVTNRFVPVPAGQPDLALIWHSLTPEGLYHDLTRRVGHRHRVDAVHFHYIDFSNFHYQNLSRPHHSFANYFNPSPRLPLPTQNHFPVGRVVFWWCTWQDSRQRSAMCQWLRDHWRQPVQAIGADHSELLPYPRSRLSLSLRSEFSVGALRHLEHGIVSVALHDQQGGRPDVAIGEQMY
jgi:hypothetical protein